MRRLNKFVEGLARDVWRAASSIFCRAGVEQELEMKVCPRKQCRQKHAHESYRMKESMNNKDFFASPYLLSRNPDGSSALR